MDRAEQARAVPADFEGFFRSNYSRVGRMVYLLTGDASEAEDLAQEAFARVFERWEKISLMENPEGYLFRVALNLQSRWLRKTGPISTLPSDPPVVTDQSASADAALDVLEALRRLPNDQRQALVLAEWLGLSSAEIGRLLDVAPTSIRGRIFRARRSLRGLLKGYETEGGIHEQGE